MKHNQHGEKGSGTAATTALIFFLRYSSILGISNNHCKAGSLWILGNSGCDWPKAWLNIVLYLSQLLWFLSLDLWLVKKAGFGLLCDLCNGLLILIQVLQTSHIVIYQQSTHNAQP